MGDVSFQSQVLEGINYIVLPPALSEGDVSGFTKHCSGWAGLVVDMHVLDFKKATALPGSFYPAVESFYRQVTRSNVRLISINMTESIADEVKKKGLDSTFSRIVNFPGDLYKKKTISHHDLRRLLFHYLAEGAHEAVKISLNSIVTCDENYSMKPEEVPIQQFDLISVVDVNNDFLKADFRFCTSRVVLEKLVKAMHGAQVAIDDELVESMALELLNMIYGYAKSNLNEKEGFQLPARIPRLFRKSEFHRIRRSLGSQLTIMPMVTPLGEFFIEVDFGLDQS